MVQNPSTDGNAATTTTAASTSSSADPAAEWLYLLFCTFVQEQLCCDVYANVGIRAGGRPQQRRRRWQRRNPGLVTGDLSVREDAAGRRGEGAGGAVASGSGVRGVSSGGDSEEPGGEGVKGEKEEGMEEDDEEEDFFYPVTPEQLIVLNLAELAAGKEESLMLISLRFVVHVAFLARTCIVCVLS